MRCEQHRRHGRPAAENDGTTGCGMVAADLAESAVGDRLLDGPGRHHVAECTRCQRELDEYRQLARALPLLRQVVVEPPAGLLDDVLAALDAAGQRPVVVVHWGRKAAYMSGLAAAAAGGALVFAHRSRRRLRPVG